MPVAGHVGTVAPGPRVPTLIYDGSCGFCRKWVTRAKKLDRRNVVRLLPLQDADAPTVSGQGRDRLEQAVHLVRPDGAVFAGAAAVREFFRYVPGGLLVRGGLAIPGVVTWAERLYAWIARTWGPVS